MNNISLVGRLTADPELKQTPNGNDVVAFTVAVDRYVKDGEKKADFIPCVAWKTTALFIARYFRKGQFIGLTGRLETRPFTDKEGNKRTAYEVVADRVYFTESKKDESKPAGASEFASAGLDDFSTVADEEGDLPF